MGDRALGCGTESCQGFKGLQLRRPFKERSNASLIASNGLMLLG